MILEILEILVHPLSRLIYALLSIALTQTCVAQAICPPGFISVGSAGQCIPEAPSGSQAQQLPSRIWQDRWGAIALGDPDVLGVSSNQTTKRKARQLAILDCSSRGGKNCASIKEYKNQCIAVASGKHRSSNANGPDEEETKSRAISTCHKADGELFEIVYSNCVDQAPLN